MPQKGGERERQRDIMSCQRIMKKVDNGLRHIDINGGMQRRGVLHNSSLFLLNLKKIEKLTIT